MDIVDIQKKNGTKPNETHLNLILKFITNSKRMPLKIACKPLLKEIRKKRC